ncbi:MAG TPA: O-antigen ligase family protein [Burkholderiales bacterium]|nr:O-antigen ligase family protein [Burkholderiales bacterium]
MRSGALWIAVAIGFSIPISTALDNLLVLALLLCWLASGGYREKLAAVRGNPFALAAIGFFLLHAGAAVYSIGSRAEVLAGLDKATVLLLVPLLVSLKPGTEWLYRALQAFLAALTLTLLLSFLVWWELVPAGTFKGYPFDPVVFKLKITHSVLMAFGAFLLAIAAREATDRRWRVLLAVGAGLAAFNVLFMVWGRTGQLVLLALIFYLLVSWLRWRGLVAAMVTGLAIGGTVYLVPSSALHQRALTTWNEIEDWRAGKPPTIANMRLETWSNSLKIVQRYPMLGAGTGGFGAAYRNEVAGSGMTPAEQSENQYLLTAVQLGGVGLMFLVALFVAQWHLAARLPARSHTVLARGLVLTMAVGCLFNSFLRDHTEALLYAWLSGLIYAGLPRGAYARA